MLRLVLGRSGSGKTHYVRDMLAKECLEKTEKIYLIVPEQYSFESEKAMLKRLGAMNAQKVNVMSFSRLAHHVFREYGGLAGTRLTDGARSVLMQLAVEEAMDRLSLYKASAGRSDFVSVMLRSVDEMKLCGISPDELINAAQIAETSELKEKITELSLIYGIYEALVNEKFVDPKDDIEHMCRILEDKDLFKDAVIAIDAFSGFTAQEYDAISIMLKNAKEVYITLCTDNDLSADDPSDPFYAVKRTASRLKAAAKRIGADIGKPVYIPSSKRFVSEEISAIEKNLFRAEKESFDKEPESIVIYEAENIYDESEYTAAAIQNLVMEKGYKYGDFAVIFRSGEEYSGYLDSSLENRNIPYFADTTENICEKPLIRAVFSAMESVISGYSDDHVLSFLKSGMVNTDEGVISELENYVYIWKISGKKWFSKWQGKTEGFSGRENDSENERLERINLLREKVTGYLKSFENAIKASRGIDIAEGIYDLLIACGAREKTEAQTKALIALGMEDEARENRRLWEIFMNVLDQMVLTIGEKTVSPEHFLSLLKIMLGNETLSDIPMGLDEVTVAQADRMRLSQPKVVFIMGAQSGKFPLIPSNEGIFSERERDELKKLGIELNRTPDESCAEERLIAYQAVSSASQMLFVSFSKENTYPSEIIGDIKKVFPNVCVKTRKELGELYFANGASPAFEWAAKCIRENSDEAETLREYFEEREDYRDKTEALERLLSDEPMKISDAKNSNALFGNDRRISATQVEMYHMCRFRYFCRYGLNAKERKPARIDALQYGSLIHYLFEKLFMNEKSEKIAEMSDEELYKKVLSLIDSYADENFGGQEDKGERFRGVLKRAARSAQIIIRYVATELSQSKFSPEGFEEEVGGEKIPLTVITDDGQKVRMTGSIDRVDSMTLDGEKFMRVIDYKTGPKEFALADVLYGINLQMLIYLAALIEKKSASPAGVLYMPSMRPSVSADRRESRSTLEAKIEKNFCMSGVILGDGEDMIRSMEKDAAGKYIPVSIKGNNISGKEYLLSKDEFYQIADYIKMKISKMAKTLKKGDIDASPLLVNKWGCEYCPYKSVCGKDYTDEDVKKEKLSNEEVFVRMREEVQ